MISDAHISDCGHYRYSLVRIWNDVPNPRILAIGALNPSTADAKKNDATIRKEIALGHYLNFDGLLKWNIYGFRETSPQKLFAAACDIIGPLNTEWAILQLLRKYNCSSTVIAWGTNATKKYAERIKTRGQHVADYLRAHNITLYCLGTNKDGSPKHPLYLPMNTTLELWPR